MAAGEDGNHGDDATGEAQGEASASAGSASAAEPSGPTVDALHRRIAELEHQLEQTVLLHERVALLEERKLGTSLEGIKDQLGTVEGRMKSIESRRDAWLRTLLLTLAAPLAAGVFGQVTKQRDVELKKFEQNLDLVDRALEFDKGPAYRKATLEYILDLNEPEQPIATWANEQLERQVNPQFDDVKSVADSKVKQVRELEAELEQSAAELEQIDEKLDRAASEPEDEPAAIERVAKDAAQRQRVAHKAQDLQDKLVSETQSANALLDQAGQAPIVTKPKPAVDDQPAKPERGAAGASEPLIYIQVASFAAERREDALSYIETLDAYPTLLLYREPFYVVMVGPYADAEAAGRVIERDKQRTDRQFDAGMKIRDLNKFCALQVQTADAVVCTPS